ncbi:MAG: hypothetical protein U9Q67_03925 [Patescibacteria group bacterium]|nr:hypothetical protein [Patescibacteria group bacterium]
MVDKAYPVFIVGLAEIMPVVRNQMPIPSELLFSYEGWPNQFDQLVEMVAIAQGAEPDTKGLRLFILHWEEDWVKWALLAKTFRKWLDSTHYTYECVSPEGLAELFLEHLVRQRICHDHSQDFRPGSRRDK